jgi:hypothetical protein
LHGAAQRFFDQSHEPWQDPEARYRLESLDELRGSFGPEQFDRAYGAGLSLSYADALDLAIGTAQARTA